MAVNISDEDIQKMIDVAFTVRPYSYSPYSHFRVGSAVLLSSGVVIGGTNVENASYGLTICAERVALCSAVSGGHLQDGHVVAIMASTDLNSFKWPCGACCSCILEFGEEVVVFSVRPDRMYERKMIRELVPFAFSKATLQEGKK
jgi:cytidine deaminase